MISRNNSRVVKLLEMHILSMCIELFQKISTPSPPMDDTELGT